MTGNRTSGILPHMTFCGLYATDLGSFPKSVIGVPQNERGMATTQGNIWGRLSSAHSAWRP